MDEKRRIPVYTDALGEQILLGHLYLPEGTLQVLEEMETNIILSPVIRVLGEEWSQDAQQTYTHVELMGLQAYFGGAAQAEDPPF